MQLPFSSWKETFAKLGYRKARRRDQRLRQRFNSRRPQIESLEQRQLLASDLVVTALYADGSDLLVDYEVVGDPATAFDLDITRSRDGVNDDAAIHSARVSDAADLSVGSHTLSISPDFTDVKEDYWLLARIDAGGEVSETDETNNNATFDVGVFQAVDGVVHVHGNYADDDISITQPGVITVRLNGVDNDFTAANVTGVHSRTHGGIDDIMAGSGVLVPVWSFGGDGDDDIFGGDASDFLDGGYGDDELKGRDGDDVLRGRAGDDDLTGDAGNDLLIGDIGVDTIDGVQESGSYATMDNGDPGFSIASGSWSYDTQWNRGHASDHHFAAAGSGGAVAEFTFADIPDGQYQVSAGWRAQWQAWAQATNTPFTLLDGSISRGTVPVNQEVLPTANHVVGSTNLQHLGAPINVVNGSLTVQVSNDANGKVLADVVRIERVGDLPSGPEIELTDGKWDIVDGSGVVDFEFTNAGTPVIKTLTVSNTGQANLTLTQIDELDLPSGYSLVSGLNDLDLAPGESADFQVQLDAVETGIHGGPVSILSNDADEGSLDFDLTGEVGYLAVMDNGDPGFSIASGSWSYDTQWNRGHASDHHFAAAGSGGAVAEFTFADIPDGQYQVSAGWRAQWQAWAQATNTPFTLLDGSISRGTVPVNQEVLPTANHVVGSTNLQHLGSPINVVNGSLTVQVSNDANGKVLADVVRIERVGDALNEAPVLTVTESQQSVDRYEVSSQQGLLLSDLLVGATDAHGGTIDGVAIIGAESTQGTVEYTTDGGATWADVGAVTQDNALLLVANAQTLIRLVPNGALIADVANALVILGWDQTAGGRRNIRRRHGKWW